ncbi:hypothetical protein D3C75_667510 [compost metagenome]
MKDGGMSASDDNVPEDEDIHEIYDIERNIDIGHHSDYRIGHTRRPSCRWAGLAGVCPDFFVCAHDHYAVLLHDLFAEPQAPVGAGIAVECVQA